MKTYDGDPDDVNQTYIVFWDMVNLYGKAMLAKLPIGEFHFLDNGKSFATQIHI